MLCKVGSDIVTKKKFNYKCELYTDPSTRTQRLFLVACVAKSSHVTILSLGFIILKILLILLNLLKS